MHIFKKIAGIAVVVLICVALGLSVRHFSGETLRFPPGAWAFGK